MLSRQEQCRQEQCDRQEAVDRSSPGGCPSRVRSTGAMSTGAMSCRLEQCLVDKCNILTTGAMFCRQEQGFIDRTCPGDCPNCVLSTGAVLEAVPAVFCQLEQCRQEKCLVDARIISTTGAMFCGQAQGFIGRKHSTGAILEAVPAVFCRQEL